MENRYQPTLSTGLGLAESTQILFFCAQKQSSLARRLLANALYALSLSIDFVLLNLSRQLSGCLLFVRFYTNPV